MRSLVALAALLAATGLVAAQDDTNSTEEDPALEEDDMDSSVPEDDAWLDEEENATYANGTSTDGNATDGGTDGATSGDDPTLDESELDASLPEGDDAWLADEERALADDGAHLQDAATPGLPLAGVLVGGALAAWAARRAK